MNAEEKIDQAKRWLAFHKFFWGTLCIRPKYVSTPEIGTGATDGKNVLYNPEYIGKLPDKQVITFVAHETGGHIGLLHHLRRGDRDPRLYNIAADYVINLILKDDGFELNKDWYVDEKYRGMSTEAVYDILKKEEKNDKNFWDKLNQNGGCGEVTDLTGENGKQLTDLERQQEEIQAKEALTTAKIVAKSMGKLPGNLERIINEIVNSTVDWKTAVLRFVKSIQRNDYTWARPNRRYYGMGLYMPLLQSEGILKVFVAVDMSGSVSQDELTQFGSEITAIRNETSATITCVPFDTRVDDKTVQTFERHEAIEIKHFYGGGTDFKPPFEWVNKNTEDKPSGMVVLTDGCCNSFPETPDYPVVWAVTETQWGSDFNPPFGEVVHVQLNS